MAGLAAAVAAKIAPFSNILSGTRIRTWFIVFFLFSLSYLLGSWHQLYRLGDSSAATLMAVKPCSNANFTRTPLDFVPHHRPDDEGSFPIEKIKSFPPCDAKYTEHTPCEDPKRARKFDRSRLIFRERHCPATGEKLKCRIPAPYGYRNPFSWPLSRDKAWFANVPHKRLTVVKAVQNWIRYEGETFGFPGGGTMFPNGADAYIDDIGKLVDLRSGEIRTAIDTGCGVASWGAYLLPRDILAMSFAPKDSHEAQVQFALERGVPALIGILASKRLPYPSRAFDMAHCSRCLIPWAEFDGIYLIEVDRVLRPGGYWVLSGPPINWKRHYLGWNRTREDLKAEQSKIEGLAANLCWKKLVERDDIAIWQKPINHLHCKVDGIRAQDPPLCQSQDSDEAWYTTMETCLTRLPEVSSDEEFAGGKLESWPDRLHAVPPRISTGTVPGVTAEDFTENTKLWKRRVAYYKRINNQLEKHGRYRNLLDMNANLGGFAAALVDDPVWVMNVAPVESKANTLGVVYERGLIGTYQSWCEAMSTYPRSYDLIHADSVFSLYKDRCEMEDIMLEIDRILRPEGSLIVRDDVDVLVKLRIVLEGMNYANQIIDHEDGPLVREKLLFAVKSYWTAPAPNSPKSS